MSDLFTEALVDSKKFREVAEQEAKNKIIKMIAPYIKKKLAEAVSDDEFFFEQDEDEAVGAAPEGETPMPAEEVPAEGDFAELPDAAGTDASADMAPPIQTGGGDELMSATMPDEEGKIVVDFEDLFKSEPAAGELPGEIPSPEETPVSAVTEPAEPPVEEPSAVPVEGEEEEEEMTPPPAVPAAEAANYSELNTRLLETADRVDRVFFSKKVSAITRQSIKQRLFELLEITDKLKTRGIISVREAQLIENKLEFLFLKLKETGLHNSYHMKDKEKNMASLHEYYAKLLAEEEENLAKDSVSTGETGVPVDDEYTKHAKEESGVSPEIGGKPEDVKVAQEETPLSEEMEGGVAGSVDEEPISGKPEKDEPWEDGEPVVAEASTEDGDKAKCAHDDVAEGAAGFGDTTEEPVAEFEVEDAAIREAVRMIRKENIRRKRAELRRLAEEKKADKAEEESWEEASPEGGADPSHEKLEENMMAEMSDDEELLMDVDDEDELAPLGDEAGLEEPMGDEMGMEDELEALGVEDDEGADIMVGIDLPPEVEAELAGLGLGDDDLDVDVELSLGGDEEEVELEVPEEEGAVEVEDDEEVELEDEEEVLPTESRAYRRVRFLETRLRAMRKALHEAQKQTRKVRSELKETNLFMSKAVLFSKFLQQSRSNKTLTDKVLRQIVEYLDRGKTVAETKAIYKSLKTKLDEHASKASKQLAGSSSKVTTPGSANLQESAGSNHKPSDGDVTKARWAELAGLKKTK